MLFKGRFTPPSIQQAAATRGRLSTTWTMVSTRTLPMPTGWSKIAVAPQLRSLSTIPVPDDDGGVNFPEFLPEGNLFESKLKPKNAIGTTLIGQTASVRRVFGPSSNAQAYLTCGGQELARHASFDPNYDQAKHYIRARAIGPAVLSPILIQGLVGALVEAALPQTVPVQSSLRHLRPLIVGAEVCARIAVTSVEERQRDFGVAHENGETGFEIVLQTEVVRVQDDAVIAEGSHTVWIPSYLKM